MVRQGLPAGPDTAPEDSAGYILPLRTLAVTLCLDAGDHDAARQWLVALDRWLDWSGSVLGQADAHLVLGRLLSSGGRTSPGAGRGRRRRWPRPEHPANR